MKKEYIIFLVIILVIVIIAFRGGQEIEDGITEVCFKENCFQVEIADTDEKRERGLMFRE